jgi:hypothetical protein
VRSRLPRSRAPAARVWGQRLWSSPTRCPLGPERSRHTVREIGPRHQRREQHKGNHTSSRRREQRQCEPEERSERGAWVQERCRNAGQGNAAQPRSRQWSGHYGRAELRGDKHPKQRPYLIWAAGNSTPKSVTARCTAAYNEKLDVLAKGDLYAAQGNMTTAHGITTQKTIGRKIAQSLSVALLVLPPAAAMSPAV